MISVYNYDLVLTETHQSKIVQVYFFDVSILKTALYTYCLKIYVSIWERIPAIGRCVLEMGSKLIDAISFYILLAGLKMLLFNILKNIYLIDIYRKEK